jgi:hypothetical protein
MGHQLGPEFKFLPGERRCRAAKAFAGHTDHEPPAYYQKKKQREPEEQAKDAESGESSPGHAMTILSVDLGEMIGNFRFQSERIFTWR